MTHHCPHCGAKLEISVSWDGKKLLPAKVLGVNGHYFEIENSNNLLQFYYYSPASHFVNKNGGVGVALVTLTLCSDVYSAEELVRIINDSLVTQGFPSWCYTQKGKIGFTSLNVGGPEVSFSFPPIENSILPTLGITEGVYCGGYEEP